MRKSVDKNLIRSYVKHSSMRNRLRCYLHQLGTDDLTAAMIQHNARVRAQTPISAISHVAPESYSPPVAQSSTPVAQPVVVQTQAPAQSSVYVYPQYTESYPAYYPTVSLGYYGYWGWPYYGSGYCGYGSHGYCGSYFHGGYYHYNGNGGGETMAAAGIIR